MAANKINQLPAELHVEIQRGDAWSITCDFNLDLTGYVIAATLHPRDGSADVTLAVNSVDLSLGQFTITLSKTASAALAADFHSWCLVMTPADGNLARTYLAGKFILNDC